MPPQQTGIFFMNAGAQTPLKAFPKEYRKRLFAGIDRTFSILLISCAIVAGTVTFLMSMRELSEVPSEKEILKIQERYAQLVLNQPKPKPEPEVEQVQQEAEETGPQEEEQEEEETVDREEETFVERQERKKSTQEERRKRRKEIAKQVKSTGIFAAITSSGGAGGTSSDASDLLGATDAAGDLSDISVSKGSFATRKGTAEELKRRGKRTSGVGIKKETVGRTEVKQIASAGDVKLSSEPPKIKGDQAQVSTSKACIQRVINRERRRLKRVYENWLKRDPQLGGRIKISFTILPSGGVSSVSVLSTSTGNSSFDRNIVRYIKRWSFTACKPASPLEIDLPFVFEGQS